MKRVGFFGVFDGADVVGSSSLTSESTTDEGTVSRSVRSDVCRRSNALCFCNATVGGEFREQSGSREQHLKYNRETLRKKGVECTRRTDRRRPGGTFVWLVAISSI